MNRRIRRQMRVTNNYVRRTKAEYKAYCVECYSTLPTGVIVNDTEMRVCINKDCSEYGKPTDNWKFD